MLQQAARAARKAYSPYSRFRVGAALRAADGTIYTGCNVENASYGLTVCAERTAFHKAVSAGARRFSALAVVADGAAQPYPCGACRQVMAEFCGPDLPIYTAPLRRLGRYETHTLGELLPRAFRLETKRKQR